MVRGELGEAASIRVNGIISGINTPISANDIIQITASTAGKEAHQNIEDLPEFHDNIQVYVNGSKVICPKFVQVNKELVSGFYSIKQEDEITIVNYYTLEQLIEFMDIILPEGTRIFLNNREAELHDRVYDNFTVDWDLSTYETVETIQEEPEIIQKANKEIVEKSLELQVIVNQQPVLLRGKQHYIFVDIFDFIDFNLKAPSGRKIVTKINGASAQYTEALKPNDVLDIYWED